MRTALVMVKVTVRDDDISDLDVKGDIENALKVPGHGLLSCYDDVEVVKVELDDAVHSC